MSTTRNRLLLRVTAPASEPISLSEAKLYLRVDGVSEDSLIGDLIVAARMAAESYVRRSLITQSWKLAYDDYISESVRLPMGPVISISSVTIIKRDNSSQLVDSAGYFLNATKDALMMDAPLIPSAISLGTRIEIVYNAGYGDASAVPKPIKQGMLAHMAHMYDNRGMASKDNNSGEWESLAMAMPQMAKFLYAPYREVTI